MSGDSYVVEPVMIRSIGISPSGGRSVPDAEGWHYRSSDW